MPAPCLKQSPVAQRASPENPTPAIAIDATIRLNTADLEFRHKPQIAVTQEAGLSLVTVKFFTSKAKDATSAGHIAATLRLKHRDLWIR